MFPEPKLPLHTPPTPNAYSTPHLYIKYPHILWAADHKTFTFDFSFRTALYSGCGGCGVGVQYFNLRLQLHKECHSTEREREREREREQDVTLRGPSDVSLSY